jgi:hypothetical protein
MFTALENHISALPFPFCIAKEGISDSIARAHALQFLTVMKRIAFSTESGALLPWIYTASVLDDDSLKRYFLNATPL